MKVIKLALLQLNKDYLWGTNGPDTFDCAGLTWYIYNSLLGIDINEDGIGKSTTTLQMTSKYGLLSLCEEEALDKESFIDTIKPGDIVFIHRQSLKARAPASDNYYPGHCGLYLGERQIIHANRVNNRVAIANLDKSSLWLEKLVGCKNIISDSEVARKLQYTPKL